MTDSYDAFERWINGMNEEMYVDWLEDTATEAQEEKALNIRQPLDEEELAEMEQEQEYIPTPESRQKEVEVYDNRDLPPKKIYAEVILPPTGRAPIIKPITNTIQAPVSEPTVLTPNGQSIPRQRFTQYPQPQPRKSISQRLFDRVSGFLSRFRRKK